MIVFPNAKINLGLYITNRRPDGYHDLVSVMLPISWRDILEIVPAKGTDTTLTVTGMNIKCEPHDNIVMRAYRALDSQIPLPPLDIYLHKTISHGAGLGGGSADASFLLTAINDMLNLDLPLSELAAIAAGLGADCPLFVYNRPMLATGTGTTLSPIEVPSLAGHTLLIIKPPVSISTAEAYRHVVIDPLVPDIVSILAMPPAQWRSNLNNAFEQSLAGSYPLIGEIKEQLYGCGALYASLSGSGSAIYGIFGDDKMAETASATFADCLTHICRL